MESLNPNDTSATLSLINSSPTIRHLRQAHAVMIKTQQSLSPHLSGRLIAAASHRHRSPTYALSIFTRLPFTPTDPFTLNSLILSLPPRLSLLFFVSHFLPHSLPNPHTLPPLLKASSLLRSLPLGSALHALTLKLNLSSNLHILTALLSLYSSLGQTTSALQLFDKTPHRDKIPKWNSIVSGLAKAGSGSSNHALRLFRRLLELGTPTPDEITFVGALTACADLGALDAVAWIHELVEKSGVVINVYVGTALVDAYAKCGNVVLARKAFDEMAERNVMSWTAMMRGLAMFGHGREAVALFEEMVKSGVRPDDVTFVGVLSACCHSGMVDEGRRIFNEMTEVFKISPKMEHYGCMVDMFSRAGMLDEALELIGAMPMEADAALWGSLLSACRRNPRNLELAEHVAGRLIEIEPENESIYVLMSNIYAYHNRWDDVGRLRTWMKTHGIAKPPGCSSLEVGGEIHEFIVGDKSHRQMDRISTMVDEIDSRVRAMGHMPDTSEVLLDIEEAEKRRALLLHSEKLALAFGLIATEKPTSVRIVKNLRVCNDCHSVMKLASRAFDREIILRDRNRFHTFRDGVCTCGDFW